MNFFSRTRTDRRAARPAPTQLKVEQLEDRTVPSGAPLCHVVAVHPGGACFTQVSHASVCFPGLDHGGFGRACGGEHGHHEQHQHHGGGDCGKHGHPQQNIGSISGTVLDDTSGNPLAGVTVTLFNSQGGKVATTTTNTSGVYTFSGLAVAAGNGTTYTVAQTTQSNYNLLTSPQTVTLTQTSQQVQNVNFDNVQNGGGVIA